MLFLVNRERELISKPPLLLNLKLSEIARKHSFHQSLHNDIYHVHPDTGNAVDRLERDWKNSHCQRLGENVACVKPCNILRMHKGLMESKGHRENILDSYQEIGLGFHLKNDGMIYGTQLFINFSSEHYISQLLDKINMERRRRVLPILEDENIIQKWSYIEKEQRKTALKQKGSYLFPITVSSMSKINIYDFLDPDFRVIKIVFLDESRDPCVEVDVY